MLSIIVLSTFWGLLATRLTSFFFWESVAHKERRYEGYPNVIWDCCSGFVVFAISCFLYTLGAQQTIFNFLPFVAVVCIVRIFVAIILKKTKDTRFKPSVFVLFIILIAAIVVLIFDSYSLRAMEIPVYTESVPNSVLTVATPLQIKDYYDLKHVEGPYYNNNRYVYIVKKEHEPAIVVINDDNKDDAQLIEVQCSPKSLFTLRDRYRTAKLKYVCVTVSDEDVPYSLFVKASREDFSSPYQVNKYILLNLITGGIDEYEEQDLPDFVKKTE